MASIHDLPAELLPLILSRFVFTDTWYYMLRVSKKWRDIVSIYVPEREKEWKDDYLASLKKRYELHLTPSNEPIQTRANSLYEVLREIAKVPKQFCPVSSSTQLIITYSDALTTYQSLPLKHLAGYLMRHRLKGEIIILICGTLMRDSQDLDPHVSSMAMRQMTHFALYEWSQLVEYAIEEINRNLRDNHVNYPAVRPSAALFNLSKFVHHDKHWETIKDMDLMHNVVPSELIPGYAILTTELKRAHRIEIIAKYYSVNQIVNHYHIWNLWQRVVVLQQIARNIHSLIDQSEYMALIEFLMTVIVNMSTNRTLIAANFGEFFDIVDVLGHFCTTPLNEELLGTRLVKLLTETMVLFQYDFPHLTDVVHGFLVKVRQLILFMKYDASADPEFIENFYPLWCDDSAIKKRKLWFIKHLLCPQNVTGVKCELEHLIEYEENSAVKRLAQEILGLSNSSI